MTHKISFVFMLCVCAFAASHAEAQQQGYSDEKPDVSVDRSVLEDLKNYQPPPMFAPTLTTAEPEPSAQPPVQSSPKKSSPNAEELLNHPTENFHVLTERNASQAIPSVSVSPVTENNEPLLPMPNDTLPVPTGNAVQKKIEPAKSKEASKDIKKDVPKKEDIKKPAEKKADVKTDTKPDRKKVETKKIEIKKEEPKKEIVKKESYRPNAPQSMPAVPPIEVEKNVLPPLSNSALPALPPTTATTEKIEKPSVGLRMIDASLAQHIESDQTKIKEKLVETVETQKKPITPKTEPKRIIPQNTLVFAANDTNLSDTMQKQIVSNILPDIQKNSSSRIQILSFATSPDKTESSARRIALARALAVRDFLKTQKVDVSKIDVRALVADENSGMPLDKIDIAFLK